MRVRTFAFTITPRKAAVLAVLALSIACLGFTSGGCSATQKGNAIAGISQAVTGHDDPASTQPATATSIEGVTATIGADATAAAAVVPPPLSAPLALIGQLAVLALALERVGVYAVAAIKNSSASPSGLNSGSSTGSAPVTPPATSSVASGPGLQSPTPQQSST